MTTPIRTPIVMIFSASDPTSGAGLQADLMTCASMGCHPLTIVSGITVQDTTGVEMVEAVEAELLEDQARLLLEDMPIETFKVGLLCSLENIQVVAEIVADYPDLPLILDPVLSSGRGDALTDEDQCAALCDLLLPQATLVTPNSIEARQLARHLQDNTSNSDGEDEDAPLNLNICAERIQNTGCEYVLITGTHEPGAEVINTLYGPNGLIQEYRWPRLPGSYHGSGCTLASAIAALVASGLAIPEAVQAAQKYTWQTLVHSFQPGMGQQIPNRLFWAQPANSKVNPQE